MMKSKASSATQSKPATRGSRPKQAPTPLPTNRHFDVAIATLLAAMDQLADSIDALPLDDPHRRQLVQLQRAAKAPLDAVLTNDVEELERLESAGLRAVRALETRHRERFAVNDCPAPCVPLDRYGVRGRVHALGDPVVGNLPTTLLNTARALEAVRELNERGHLDGDDFAVAFPWIALSLHEAKVSAGQGALLPEQVANRPAASHLPRTRGGKQASQWPEYARLKTCFELWKSNYSGSKLSDAAYQSLIVEALKELGADENPRKGLFKGQAMRRHRGQAPGKPGQSRSAVSG